MGGMWLSIGLVVGTCWGAWIATVGDRLDRRDRERARREDVGTFHSEFGEGFNLEPLPKDYRRHA